MRHVENPRFRLGQVPVDQIQLNPKSRDDIPAILRGLQLLYTDEAKREALFALLDRHVLPGMSRRVGRPGMDLWRILVLGVVKQGLGCDWDRLHELANEHRTLRLMLGHSEVLDEDATYEHQTVVDNVSLLTPELLSEVNRLVVVAGHEVAGKKPGAALGGRCDSFVVETDVHWPTDVSLLWDAMRCLIRDCARSCREHGVGGWRQHRHLTQGVKELFQRVNTARRRHARPGEVEALLDLCRGLAERAEASVRELRRRGAGPAETAPIDRWLRHARRQVDQVDRRLLRGEAIPHGEKAFSIFEEHTRWIVKGKAGVQAELGVPVCVVEDLHGFLLHHKVLWKGGDADAAVPVVEEVQGLHPSFRACSFDRGFHSPANRVRLDALLDLGALPKKGRLSRAGREREEAADFAAARRRHPGVESAINNLEHRGLDRVRSRGAEGFARTVALAVLALNVHRVGLLLQRKERARLARQKRRRLRRAA